MATKTAALKKDTGKSTTAVAVTKPSKGTVATNNVSDIQARLREQAAQMAERTAPATGNKIMPGNDKMFKLPDGTKVAELKAVIADFVSFHAFYERPFDPKNIVPPGCFAVGLNPKLMAPVAESPNLQAENCQVCPMNEFGSSGEGKACKNGRRLALLPPNDDGTDVDADADMMILDVSPTALKAFDGYVQSLSRMQLIPAAVMTTITLDPNVDYAKLVFSDPVPVNGVGAVLDRQPEAREMLMAKPDFSGYVPLDTKPKAAGRAGARR